MIDRAEIESLVPHAGSMCLWDEVIAWDPQRITLRSNGHRDPAHPLRSHDRLRAIHLCEYGAQAMAVHGGLIAREAGASAPPGMLVALRGVDLQCTRIDDLPGPLECEAEVLVAGEGAQQYRFTIRHDGTLLAEGRAAVMLQPQERPA
jgi:predicted hotdog family 3-hydroxylacyl-ACP dehydratase